MSNIWYESHFNDIKLHDFDFPRNFPSLTKCMIAEFKLVWIWKFNLKFIEYYYQLKCSLMSKLVYIEM